MIFAVIKPSGEPLTSFVFPTWEMYHRATFSPDSDVRACYPLKIEGKTYQERKNSLRDLAINIQHADDGGLSWSEYAMLGDFFERNARRYGLLTEFRANAICA